MHTNWNTHGTFGTFGSYVEIGGFAHPNVSEHFWQVVRGRSEPQMVEEVFLHFQNVRVFEGNLHFHRRTHGGGRITAGFDVDTPEGGVNRRELAEKLIGQRRWNLK